MARIENHKYSIDEAFRECFYVIPDYQREYVWTEKEVQQLLEDINEQVEPGVGREYFIGTVLVSPTNQKNHYEVIDGQQRLTTFYLLLCALRHLFKDQPQRQTIAGLISTSYTDAEGNSCASFKLEPRYENAGELMARIVEADADPEATRAKIRAAGVPHFGSLENLLNAYATTYKYLLENYDEPAKLRRYWGYLANNVVFIQISTDVSSALKIFETINERGVGLNSMDLLKNLLFTHVRHDQFTKLKDEWKKITKPLEKEKEKPLRFLRYFLMANYRIDNDRRDGVVREDEIYEWFVDKKNAELCDYENQPFEFVRKIVRNVEHYLHFVEGRGNDGKSNLAMESLAQLSGVAFSLQHVLLLAASGLPKSLFDHFVSQLESFLFFFIFTKTPTKSLERDFSKWADEIREIVATSDSALQRRMLDAFVNERFQASMESKSRELVDALNRYTLNSMQKYRTRYFLAKLTQHVDMAYKGLKVAGSLDDYMELEIEHILPDRPESILRDAFALANPGAAYEGCKIRLGNLTLLEKPLNVVAGNDFFEAKLNEYRKCKYYLTSSVAGLVTVGKNTSVNRINEKLLAFNDWTAAGIERRQVMLIELARDVWRTRPIEDA